MNVVVTKYNEKRKRDSPIPCFSQPSLLKKL